jgi:hypothetical protein
MDVFALGLSLFAIFISPFSFQGCRPRRRGPSGSTG